ncbi:MAG: hypothetical protein JWM33_2306 [Caulobacteraceae bacterium]|nr:hypothetical protein [Caulobacteraceae bacterium]
MKISALVAVAVATMACGAAAAPAGGGAAWATVTAEADSSVAHVQGGVDIDAPPQLVWTVMTDCKNAFQLITNLKSCKIIEGDMAKGWDVREHVTGSNFVFPGLRIVFRSDYTPYSKISFHLVEGDLKSEQGVWSLTPINGGAGTRVGYENRLAAKSAFAPAVLVRQSLRKDTPQALSNLKTAVMAAKLAG